MPEILLNPGPVVLSQRVRHVLLRPDLCHREIEFIELQNTIRHDLLNIYTLPNSEWAAILILGSGTAATEAMMTSMVPDHGKILIIENGVYGERLHKIAQIHHINHAVLHHPWGAPIDLPSLEGELRHHKDISHVAVVHHETTTGRLNDMHGVATLCGRYNVPILLDGVSSFGAENIAFDHWNIIACAASANKCLHAVPGAAFVICRRDAFGSMQATPPRTLYLDLANHLHDQDANSTSFTQSVQIFYALAEALKELQDQGGQKARQKHYWQKLHIIREGLSTLDITPWLPAEECSCVLNAFHLPKGIDYETLHDGLKKHGFVIYAGQGALYQSMFRISCMGEIDEHDIHRFLNVMTEVCVGIPP